MIEKKYRSIIKAVSYRLAGSFATFLVSYIITGKFNMALTIGGIEVISKFALYYLHERMWGRVKWGIVEENEGIDYNI